MIICPQCGGQVKAWSNAAMLVQKSTGLERVDGGSVKLHPRLDRPGCEIQVTCPGCQEKKKAQP